MGRLIRFVTTATTAAVLTVSLAACKDERTPEQQQADQAIEQQHETNKEQETDLGHLLDPTGWNETEITFTEGSGDEAIHYAIVTTGEVSCSPKFRLVPASDSAEAYYYLVAIVHETEKVGGVLAKDLPPGISQDAKNLTKTAFNKRVRAHRASNPTLARICTDR